jgi:hypothetical protein
MDTVSKRICMLLLGSVALSADTWTIVAQLPDAMRRPSAAGSGGDGLMYAIGGSGRVWSALHEPRICQRPGH